MKPLESSLSAPKKTGTASKTVSVPPHLDTPVGVAILAFTHRYGSRGGPPVHTALPTVRSGDDRSSQDRYRPDPASGGGWKASNQRQSDKPPPRRRIDGWKPGLHRFLFVLPVSFTCFQVPHESPIRPRLERSIKTLTISNRDSPPACREVVTGLMHRHLRTSSAPDRLRAPTRGPLVNETR